MATNDAWLSLVDEEALEPELPICDPHHHLWDFRAGTVDRRYLIDEFLGDLGCGHNIVSTVFIECGTMFKADGPEEMRPVGETEFVNGIAAMSASGGYGTTRIAAGIVGTAYLTIGDEVGATLDKQIEAGGGRFRGIRQAATWHPSPRIGNHRTEPGEGLYGRGKFREGFAHLAPRALTFEAWCYHTQIDELTALAKAFPDTTIILNHFGGPIGVGPYAGQGDEVFSHWKRALQSLAECPNVHAKLGGLGMEVNGFEWHKRARPPSSEEVASANRRYHETTIEAFGVERCMFESNFPVDKVSYSYTVIWNAFKRLTKAFSDDEKRQLFCDNAHRVYGLD
ncbi:MAG: amidohydrolase family protein [Gammaproteobacteria bacterium]|nr:amidohydrolase family protein [Gammaproteobacteria bacterium]